jgi:hypothetical protein
VRVCAAVGWLDFVDRDVLGSYMARPAPAGEREVDGNGQSRHDLPVAGIPRWVWATTGLCVVASVLLVMPRVDWVESRREPETGFETPALRPTMPPVALEPMPMPSPSTSEPRAPPAPPRAAPIADRDEVMMRDGLPPASAAVAPSSFDAADARSQAESHLELALERLDEITRVEWGRAGSPRQTLEPRAVSVGDEAESAVVGVAAAIRIGERIQPVWIEFELGPRSGATLRIQEPGSQPETIGKWASSSKAQSELGDSLIRWYRRHASKPRKVAKKATAAPYEIPAFGGRK